MTLFVNELSYSVDKKVLLSHINLEISSGSMVGIIGPNGAGKSTLLKHIAGILSCKPSCMMLDTTDLSKLEPRKLAKEVAYLSQFLQVPRMNVLETLELGRRAYGGMLLKKEDYKKIDEIVLDFNLEEMLERSLETLSGGERQKVMIASALLQEPKILLLDEPISHLDPKNQLEMLSAVRKVTIKKNLMTLIVLHDIQHAMHYANTLLMLKQGEILHYAPTKTVKAQMLKELFDVETTLHTYEGHTFISYGHSHAHDHAHQHIFSIKKV